LAKYQTLHFDEALQIALSESLHTYNSSQEDEDLALAIQMSLANEDSQKQFSCSDSGISSSTLRFDEILVLILEQYNGM
jgi:Ubiquitin interaction motif